MEFFPETKLGRDAAEAMARGLYAIAKSDGLHDREAGLIASFWIDVGGGDVALSDLERSEAIKPAELAAALHTDHERRLFLKTAILLTWADGKVTDAEHKAVREYARALNIDDASVDRLAEAVKEFLLSHVSHLQNSDAASAVAKKLQV